MKVILDCDPGNGFPGADIDDGLALGLLLASPEVELLAVTVVAGNVPLADGVRSGLAMLELAGSDVPLHAGAALPLVEDPVPWRAELDGRGYRGDAPGLWASVAPPAPIRRAAEVEDAATAIVRLVNAYPGEIYLIAVGPLTNVALAFRLDPSLPGKLARLLIMGGGFGVADYPQELNFGYDPEAARIVVTAGGPTLLIPLDLTLTTYFRITDNDRLRGARSAFMRYLGNSCEPWIRYVAALRNRDGCALHDPLAVVALLRPDLITSTCVHVDVELAGRLTRGRPVAWRPGYGMHQGLALPAVPTIEVARRVDHGPMVDFLLDRLLAHTAPAGPMDEPPEPGGHR